MAAMLIATAARHLVRQPRLPSTMLGSCSTSIISQQSSFCEKYSGAHRKSSTFANNVSDQPDRCQLNFQVNGEEYLGNGTPLVFIPGVFGAGRNFHTPSKKISDHLERASILLDMRNHGGSEHSDHMTYDAMIEDVLAFLRVNKIDTIKLIGHSMGGKISMLLSLKHPEVVERLMVLDAAPNSKESVLSNEVFQLALTMNDMDLSTVTNRKSAEQYLITKGVESPATRAFLLQNLLISKNQPAKWRLNLDAIIEFMPQVMNCDIARDYVTTEVFQGPTMFFYGTKSDRVHENDPDIPVLFPNFRFVSVEAGHWVHSEKMVEFVDNCRTFMAD